MFISFLYLLQICSRCWFYMETDCSLWFSKERKIPRIMWGKGCGHFHQTSNSTFKFLAKILNFGMQAINLDWYYFLWLRNKLFYLLDEKIILIMLKQLFLLFPQEITFFIVLLYYNLHESLLLRRLLIYYHFLSLNINFIAFLLLPINFITFTCHYLFLSFDINLMYFLCHYLCH